MSSISANYDDNINYRLKPNSYYIKTACLIFSIGLLAACPIAASYIDSWKRIIPDFYQILTMPSPLVTDYFYLGNLASAFLNAGLCGLACTLIMIINKTACPPSFLAGYFLVIAHCFYGLNFLNMWPPMLGIYAFCHLNKLHFNENLDMAMFSTAFGPFISEMLFRYHVNEEYIVWKTQVSFIGLFYAVIFSIFLGFAIPAMLPGALRLHKGFNLFNGGLAFGLLGLFIYSYMYKTFGITAPTPLKSINVTYNAHGNSYGLFIISFFSIMFFIFLIYGWFLNGKSFRGYGKLLESLNQLAETTEEYYWKNEEGKMPALKKEDIVKIRNAYKEVIKNCNRMLAVPENELKGVHVLVDEMSVLLSRDEAALDVATQEKYVVARNFGTWTCYYRRYRGPAYFYDR